MRIIRDLEVVNDDLRRLADDEPLGDGPVSVSLARWATARDALADRDRVGVHLQPDEDIAPILPDLGRIAVITFLLPRFSDGRPYSRARLLRERHEYDGELRAAGDVLRDQLLYLWRCGFNAFEIRGDRDAEDALRGLADFTVALQPAAAPPPHATD